MNTRAKYRLGDVDRLGEEQEGHVTRMYPVSASLQPLHRRVGYEGEKNGCWCACGQRKVKNASVC